MWPPNSNSPFPRNVEGKKKDVTLARLSPHHGPGVNILVSLGHLHLDPDTELVLLWSFSSASSVYAISSFVYHVLLARQPLPVLATSFVRSHEQIFHPACCWYRRTGGGLVLHHALSFNIRFIGILNACLPRSGHRIERWPFHSR